METFDSALYAYCRLLDSYTATLSFAVSSDQFLQISLKVAGNTSHFPLHQTLAISPRLLLATHLQKGSYPSFPLATNQFHSQS